MSVAGRNVNNLRYADDFADSFEDFSGAILHNMELNEINARLSRKMHGKSPRSDVQISKKKKKFVAAILDL